MKNFQIMAKIAPSKKFRIKYLRSAEFRRNGGLVWEDDIKSFEIDADNNLHAIDCAESTFRLWNMFSKNGRKYEIRDCEEI